MASLRSSLSKRAMFSTILILKGSGANFIISIFFSIKKSSYYIVLLYSFYKRNLTLFYFSLYFYAFFFL